MSLTLGTPLAEALTRHIQEKLVEIGWSVMGEDSSPLSEYICLMVVNGKTQEQIADELSGDLLGLSKDDDSAVVFSRWLFHKLEELRNSGSSSGGAGGTADGEHSKEQNNKGRADGGIDMASASGGDTDMDGMGGNEVESSVSGVPTGPKAMRGQQGRGGRLFNQISKAMERPVDAPLRGVRSRPGERIEKREPPKGPRLGPSGIRNSITQQQQQQQQQQYQPLGRGSRMGAMVNGRAGVAPSIPIMAGPPSFTPMTPQQTMEFYQMMQQQVQMMGFPIPPNPMMLGPNGFIDTQAYGGFGQQQPTRGSLFDRVEIPAQSMTNSPPTQQQQNVEIEQKGDSDDMEMDETPTETIAAGEKKEDSFTIPCKFALSCARPECPYGHQSPSATGRPAPSSFTEKCPYAEHCRNRKCTGAHSSPILAPVHQLHHPKPSIPLVLADCRFYPNCANPVCPYRHPDPTMPPCRNGPSCTRPGCHFNHKSDAEIPTCKFNPCLKPNCVFKHAEGQQQSPPASAGFENKVWSANGKKEHVSERKFVSDDGGEEELIIPGQGLTGDSNSNHKNRSNEVDGVSGGSGAGESNRPGSAASETSSKTLNRELVEAEA